MSRASKILDLLWEQNDSGGTGGGAGNGSSGTSGGSSGNGNGGTTNGGNSGDDNGDSDGYSEKPNGKKKKKLGVRSRISPTVVHKCNCDKPKSELSAYCRKYCGKD